jgi:glucokinase
LNAVGVDVGGTKIAAGLVTPEGKILKEARYPTPTSGGRLVEIIARAVSEVKDGYEVGGVCLAVAGMILAQANKVVFSPNLRAVEGIPLKDELEPRIGLPLTLENDATAAAWGEFRFGVGSEADHLVFVTLGTGIGGGVIAHGFLLRGAQGSGGELGHVTIQGTGPRCALGRLAAERKVLGEDVTRLAREGDEAALSVLEEAGRWLGIGLAGFVNVFNPEVVAIGGGVAKAGEFILEAARQEVYLRARSPSRDLVEVKEAALGPDSGVLGAAALARDPSSGEHVLGN